MLALIVLCLMWHTHWSPYLGAGIVCGVCADTVCIEFTERWYSILGLIVCLHHFSVLYGHNSESKSMWTSMYVSMLFENSG